MAELLGVVAGGAGVASLAMQIIDKTGQLCKLIKSIKDAPNDIRDMLEEVHLMAQVLSEFEEFYRHETETTLSKSAVKTLEFSQRLASLLTSILNDLQTGIDVARRTRIRKSIKAVWRKDEIKHMTSRIQRALQLLGTISQIYSHTLQSNKLDLVISQQLVNVAPSGSSSGPSASGNEATPLLFGQSPISFRQGQSSFMRWNIYPIFFGSLYIGNGVVRSPRKKNLPSSEEKCDTTWEVRFYPTSWFRSKAYMIFGWSSSGHWQYNLRTYTMRDHSASIFFACFKRDVEKVRQLLDHGLASPFDIAPNGLSPLHYASIGASVQVCQLLIERGADSNYSSPQHEQSLSPLLLLAKMVFFARQLDPLSSGNYISPQDLLGTVRTLVGKGQADPLITANEDIPSVLHRYGGPLEPFRWLMQSDRDNVSDDANSAKRTHRLYWRRYLAHIHLTHPLSFRMSFLGCESWGWKH